MELRQVHSQQLVLIHLQGDSLHYIVSVNLTNLIPQTFYYFRLKGIDANGVTIYGIKTFFTVQEKFPIGIFNIGKVILSVTK